MTVALTISVLNLVAASCMAVFAVLTYRTAIQKRKDDLFDRRYKFYRELEKAYCANPVYDNPDFEALSDEAKFLFGDDIAKLIKSFCKRISSEATVCFPKEISKKFEKYLKLD